MVKKEGIFLALLALISVTLISIVSAQSSGQAFIDFLQTEPAAYMIWFMIFFCVIFFSAKQIFGANDNISITFSIVASILTTVGLMRSYPNIMQKIGIFSLVLLGIAAILLIVALSKKAGIGGGGFKPTLYLILAGYLLFWILFRFTNLFPSGFKDALTPYQTWLDVIAFICTAILVIAGAMSASKKKLPANVPPAVEQPFREAQRAEAQGRPDEAAKKYAEAADKADKAAEESKKAKEDTKKAKEKFFTTVGMHYKTLQDIETRYSQLTAEAKKRYATDPVYLNRLVVKLQERKERELEHFGNIQLRGAAADASAKQNAQIRDEAAKKAAEQSQAAAKDKTLLDTLSGEERKLRGKIKSAEDKLARLKAEVEERKADYDKKNKELEKLKAQQLDLTMAAGPAEMEKIRQAVPNLQAEVQKLKDDLDRKQIELRLFIAREGDKLAENRRKRDKLEEEIISVYKRVGG